MTMKPTKNRMLLTFIALACGAFILILSCAKESQEVPATYAGIEKTIDSLLSAHVDDNPGIRSAVVLVEGPGFKHKAAAGMADSSKGIPMHVDDQFYLASTAKMMTACAVMKYVERGEISLDHHIADYLPDSVLNGLHTYEGQSYEKEITIRQLLNHTAGLADAFHDDRFIQLMIDQPEKFWYPLETIAYVKENLTPYHPPGTAFRYSDMHFNLLGFLIEKLSGLPLTEAFHDMFYNQLAMNDTYRRFFEEPRHSTPGRPPSRWYRSDFDCTELRSITADWAGGGLFSNTEDLNRFLHAFVENRIFSDSSTRDTMLQWIRAGEGWDYGLGIIRGHLDVIDTLFPAEAGEIWGHQGASSAFMYYWPKKQVYFCGTFNQMSYESLGLVIIADICRFILRSETGT